MDYPLHVVVGGSSEVGRIVCGGLSGRGRQVISTHFAHPLLQDPPIISLECDVRSPAECESIAGKAFETSDRVFLTYLPSLKVDRVTHRLSSEEWLRVIDVNLNGAFNVASAFLRRMRERKFGRIVLVGSVSGRMGYPGTAAYSASKEALRGLTRVIASENAALGITANYIELGFMKVGMSLQIPTEVQQRIKASIPAGDFGEPDSLIEALLFIEQAPYVTGAGISIAGGL
jgi:NAD(P)-dependent dehydrogenase (short-subunit alcohol dehydrogenase family)